MNKEIPITIKGHSFIVVRNNRKEKYRIWYCPPISCNECPLYTESKFGILSLCNSKMNKHIEKMEKLKSILDYTSIILSYILFYIFYFFGHLYL